MTPRAFPTDRHQHRLLELRLRGSLDSSDVAQIGAMLASNLRGGVVQVVLHLGAVDHIQLTALPMLQTWAVKLREYGGDLKVVGASGHLAELFILAEMKDSFDFCATEDEAAAAFAIGHRPRLFPKPTTKKWRP